MQHLDVISPVIKKKGVLAVLAKPLFFHHSVILHSMQLKHAKLHTSQGHLTWTRKTNMCQDTKKL